MVPSHTSLRTSRCYHGTCLLGPSSRRDCHFSGSNASYCAFQLRRHPQQFPDFIEHGTRMHYFKATWKLGTQSSTCGCYSCFHGDACCSNVALRDCRDGLNQLECLICFCLTNIYCYSESLPAQFCIRHCIILTMLLWIFFLFFASLGTYAAGVTLGTIFCWGSHVPRHYKLGVNRG